MPCGSTAGPRQHHTAEDASPSAHPDHIHDVEPEEEEEAGGGEPRKGEQEAVAFVLKRMLVRLGHC